MSRDEKYPDVLITPATSQKVRWLGSGVDGEKEEIREFLKGTNWDASFVGRMNAERLTLIAKFGSAPDVYVPLYFWIIKDVYGVIQVRERIADGNV